MAYDADGRLIVPPVNPPHYHGVAVRILFIAAALVLLIAASTGATLPLSDTMAVLTAIALMIAAGITNPEQTWIHWINGGIAMIESVLFALGAIGYYRISRSIFDPTFLFTEILAVIFLLALYFSTKTVRGIFLRTHGRKA